MYRKMGVPRGWSRWHRKPHPTGICSPYRTACCESLSQSMLQVPKKFIWHKQEALEFHLLPAYSSVKCRVWTCKLQSTSSPQLQSVLSGPRCHHIPIGTQVLHLIHQFCVKLTCLIKLHNCCSFLPKTITSNNVKFHQSSFLLHSQHTTCY